MGTIKTVISASWAKALIKGAVIDSNAPAEKNKFTTGTLTWEDQQNKADYKTSGAGISYAGNEGFDINVKGNTDLKGAVIDSENGNLKERPLKFELTPIS